MHLKKSRMQNLLVLRCTFEFDMNFPNPNNIQQGSKFFVGVVSQLGQGVVTHQGQPSGIHGTRGQRERFRREE